MICHTILYYQSSDHAVGMQAGSAAHERRKLCEDAHAMFLRLEQRRKALAGRELSPVATPCCNDASRIDSQSTPLRSYGPESLNSVTPVSERSHRLRAAAQQVKQVRAVVDSAEPQKPREVRKPTAATKASVIMLYRLIRVQLCHIRDPTPAFLRCSY
jgi:hypothetical protein